MSLFQKNNSDIIKYFRACYENDNRLQNLTNIFSARHEMLHIVENTGNINGMLEYPYSLQGDYRKRLASSLQLYKTEKNFIFTAFFLVCRVNLVSDRLDKKVTVCAPVVYFDAEEQAGTAIIDKKSFRFNMEILSEFTKKSDFRSHFDRSGEIFPGTLGEISDLLESAGIEIDKRFITENSLFIGEDELRKTVKNYKKEKPLLIPAAGFMLTKSSATSGGVLHELEEIAEKRKLSAPLEQLLTGKKISAKNVHTPEPFNIPGFLSGIQEKVLQNASELTLSSVIGPPGTGKSYTIAALALEAFQSGKSVLIVSNGEHAVDVVMEKLIDTFGISSDSIIRAGRKNYLKELKEYIKKVTAFTNVDSPVETGGLAKKLKQKKKALKSLDKKFVKECKNAIDDGLFLKNFQSSKKMINIFGSLRHWLLKRRLGRTSTLYKKFSEIQSGNSEREALISDYINLIKKQKLHNTLKKKRKDLINFSKALRARTSGNKEHYFSSTDFSILLETLPIWLVSLQSLQKVLPLKKELFDIVIFDEATKADLAISIPALYRAEKAVIVGDPNQLRHISFLSYRVQKMLSDKFIPDGTDIDTNYRDNSLIDYALGATSASVMLDEHYRSLPGIISFSNREFYGGKLRIMTEKPLLHTEKPLVVVNCTGERKNSVNIEEAAAVIKYLLKVIASDKKKPSERNLSIGVLSFFRDQAELLEREILKALDLDTLKKYNIRAGTPYAFQGEERDIMLISSAVDNNTGENAYRYLNRPDVFNVAITRAKTEQVIFLSAEIDKLPNSSLFSRYLKEIKNRKEVMSSVSVARDHLQDEVCTKLEKRGFKIWKNYPVAGIPIDILSVFEKDNIAIDLIGFPGELQDALHLERYKIFERAGLKLFPLSYSVWVYKQDEVFSHIEELVTAKLPEFQSAAVVELEKNLTPRQAEKVTLLKNRLRIPGREESLDSLNKLIQKHDFFMKILKEKLNPSELTYARYDEVAKELFLGVLNNIEKFIYTLESLNMIDIDEIEERLLNLSENDREMKESLLERKNLYETQRKKALQLQRKNDEAIALIEKAAVEFTNIDTSLSEEGAVIENTMNELRSRMKTIGNYSRI